MRFRFSYSHAFHGARLTIEDDGDAGPTGIVDFGDGTSAIAEYTKLSEMRFRLSIPSYRTARGSVVKARTWLVAKSSDHEWRVEAHHEPPTRSLAEA